MPWIIVAERSRLATRRWLEVQAGRAAIMLYDIDGAVHATAAICPHHAAFLSQGSFSGDTVDCPRHQGRFHIPTGALLRGPVCESLKTYPTRVQDGRVLVEV